MVKLQKTALFSVILILPFLLFSCVSSDSEGNERTISEISSKFPSRIETLLDNGENLKALAFIDRRRREGFNAGDFLRLADDAVKAVWGRGRIPVLSGGTAFYFKTFLFGLPNLPGENPELRKELARQLADSGIEALYRELKQWDAETASRLEPGDSSRILRALEVFRSSGRPLSAFPLPTRPREEFSCLLIGLERPREELYERINRRVDIMFEQGLTGEIKTLLSQGAKEEFPGMKGIGYSEFFDLFREGCLTLPQVRERIKRNSRRYAKRQLTFFRSLPGVRWFHPSQTREVQAAVKSFMTQWGKAAR